MATVSMARKSGTSTRLLANVTWPPGRMDYALLIATVALVAVGLMMVYSASLFVSLRFQEGSPITYYFTRQLLGAGLGLAGLVVLLLVDYHLIRKLSTVAMLITLALLFVVLLFGAESLGATRGLFGGAVQPSELAKLVTIFYVADWLSSKGERIRDFGMGFVPFVSVVGIVGGLIAAQPDISQAALIAFIAFTMFFVAGARFSHFLLILLVGVIALVLLITIFPHAADRWDEYWTMLQDPTGELEYHTQQVIYSFARGGLFGQGLGNSFQKTGPLPLPHNDSIVAVIGEELGLVGCLFVLGLLLYIGFRGLRIAQQTEDTYGRLLALGITSWLVYQGLVNAAVMVGIIPFTGSPFPFVSAGGSSMATSVVGVGVLLSISQHNRRLEEGRARPAVKPQRANGAASSKRAPATVKRSVNAAVGVGRRDGRTYLARAGHRR